MVSLKTDQLHQMWSYLGGKYMPSVLYQVKVIYSQAEETSSDETIKKTKINL